MNRLEQLRRLEPEFWALMELREDPMFCRIDPGRYGDYVNRSMEDGRKKAAMYNPAAIDRSLREHGIIPELACGEHPAGIHSEAVFIHGAGRIRIYEQALRSLALSLEDAGIGGGFEELETLHTAHEFYHCLEYWNGEDISRTCPEVVYRFLGIIPRKGYVGRTREIAAHTFAETVCRPEIHPKLMDYLLLERQDEEAAAAYYAECMEWSETWKELHDE